MTRCSIAGCPLAVRRRGMCGKHYQRWRRHGDPHVRKASGPGVRGLSPERQHQVRHAAGVKGMSVRWLRWRLEEVRRAS